VPDQPCFPDAKTMTAKKLTIASATVTLKLPVGVPAPSSTNVLSAPGSDSPGRRSPVRGSASRPRDQPEQVVVRMKKRRSGAAGATRAAHFVQRRPSRRRGRMLDEGVHHLRPAIAGRRLVVAASARRRRGARAARRTPCTRTAGWVPKAPSTQAAPFATWCRINLARIEAGRPSARRRAVQRDPGQRRPAHPLRSLVTAAAPRGAQLRQRRARPPATAPAVTANRAPGPATPAHDRTTINRRPTGTDRLQLQVLRAAPCRGWHSPAPGHCRAASRWPRPAPPRATRRHRPPRRGPRAAPRAPARYIPTTTPTSRPIVVSQGGAERASSHGRQPEQQHRLRSAPRPPMMGAACRSI